MRDYIAIRATSLAKSEEPPLLHRKSLTLVALATVTVILLSFCVAPILKQREWSRLMLQMDSTLRSLRPTQPNAIDPAAWDCAHGWVMTAFCNFTPERISTDEMYQLQGDLECKLTEKIDLDTLQWIWDRFGRTGPRGKEYIERYRPMFRECLPRE